MDRYCVYALWGLAGLGMVTAGCQAPSEPAGPTVERVAARSQDDLQALFEAACDTLRAYAFRIDRQDRVNGVITTHPETTAQGFEFWRPQGRSAYTWLEDNLHTVREQVTVRIRTEPSSADTEGSPCVEVEVERFRYRLPERQIDNPAAAMRIFSADAPTVAGRLERPSKTGYWIRLGRDEAMEHSLLAGILRRYTRSTLTD